MFESSGGGSYIEQTALDMSITVVGSETLQQFFILKQKEGVSYLLLCGSYGFFERLT